MFSTRTAWDLAPNAYSVSLERARRSPEFLDLTESNPTRLGLGYPAEEILAAIAQERSLLYEPTPFGQETARQAIAESYRAQGVAIDPGRIVLTASSSEAYGWILKLLCDPGDSILVPQPSYPLFDDLARLECVTLRGYGLFYDGLWHIDTASLRQAVGPGTRALFLVNPNNPTGSYLSRAERIAIEDIASAQDLAIVSDEVFADYVWSDSPERVACLAGESSVLSFSLGGLSKSLCLPQLKLGWVVVGGPDKQVHEALARLEMVADTYLSVGTPIQHAVPGLLRLQSQIREALRDRLLANLNTLRSKVGSDSAVTVLEVAAGWYAVLRVPNVLTDEQWAVLLLDSDNVAVHPGSFFSFPTEGYLVVSLLPSPASFEEALGRVLQRVRAICET